MHAPIMATALSASSLRFQAGSSPLPAPLRPQAELGILDATEWYGETSGGIRTYLREKSRYVAERQALRHTIVVPGPVDSVDDESGVRMFRLRGPAIPRHRPYRFMLATRSVARIVRHERPDVIEVGSPFLVPWIMRHVTRTERTPLVYYHHTDVPRIAARAVASQQLKSQVQRATWRYLRAIAERSAATIVATAGGAAELEAQGLPRVVHIPLGVDLSTFNPNRNVTREQVRQQLALPDAPLAVFAGRFAREKEIDTLLDGWAEVERTTGARLLLVGAGPDEARLRAHSYASRVFFRPFMQDRHALASLFSACDAYVAPGPAETFGLAAVEGMACGLPVLTVASGAVAEHVSRSHAGQAYTRSSASDMATAAHALFTSDFSQLSRRAREFAVSEHDWNCVFDRLFAVYADIARNSR